MEKARIRAVEMIAMAEAVGAQRVAASTASVNKLFDENHPELAAVHPAVEGTGSPRPGADSSQGFTDIQSGSPASLHSMFRMAHSLPELTDITSLSARALESAVSTSTSDMQEHHGCIVVTIHEAVDLKSTSHKPTAPGRRVLVDSSCLLSVHWSVSTWFGLRVLTYVRVCISVIWCP